MTPLATLVRTAIDPMALVRAASSPGNGAVILFLGAVRQVNEGRGVTGIDYAAYEGMALRELQAIVDEGAARFGTAHVVGRQALGAGHAICLRHVHRTDRSAGGARVLGGNA